MSTTADLVRLLVELDDPEFMTVVEQARRERVARQPPAPPRPARFDRDQLARWYAAAHMRVDPGIREAAHLPTGAGEREIRLIEVNAFSAYPPDSPVEAIDFGVDFDRSVGEHKVFVADVSSEQWERIKDGRLALPVGWSLSGSQVLSRNQR